MSIAENLMNCSGCRSVFPVAACRIMRASRDATYPSFPTYSGIVLNPSTLKSLSKVNIASMP